MNPVDELLSLILRSDGEAGGGGGACNISVVDRRVLASRPLEPGDAIGPPRGVSSEDVVDPVEVLRSHALGRAALDALVATAANSHGGGKGEKDGNGVGALFLEKVAFWMALAAMGREAEDRRRERLLTQREAESDSEVGVADNDAGGNDDGTNPKKKRRMDDAAAEINSDREERRRRVVDAYLLSLPKEGPDPCCWRANERSTLLRGTPMLKQVDNALAQVREEYDRAVAGLCKDRVADYRIPPFDVDGRGTFPSVLWARSMHISRSFPRSLIDEEGMWWVGRKRCVANRGGGGSDDGRGNGAGSGGGILSVVLGGCRAPEITVRQEAGGEGGQHSEQPPAPQPEEEQLQPPSSESTAATAAPQSSVPEEKRPPPPAGSDLGMMLPLYDMLDHKPGHAVQWESEAETSSENGVRRRIRFRCVHPIAAGEQVYNNYGAKGNAELLATYGFAARDNVLDSVEGIVLGLRVPPPSQSSPAATVGSGENGHENRANGGSAEGDADLEQVLHEARMALIKEHSVPHRFEKDGSVLLLGPFSLHRRLPPRSAPEEGVAGAGSEDEGEDGVIPQSLYYALSLIGMLDAEEGPVVSEDELDMLSDVLRKKLDGFDPPSDAESESVKHNDSMRCRAESVEAYKEGQRRLLRLALEELEALMPER